jgi:hypothetical protein
MTFCNAAYNCFYITLSQIQHSQNPLSIMSISKIPKVAKRPKHGEPIFYHDYVLNL